MFEELTSTPLLATRFAFHFKLQKPVRGIDGKIVSQSMRKNELIQKKKKIAFGKKEKMNTHINDYYNWSLSLAVNSK